VAPGVGLNQHRARASLDQRVIGGLDAVEPGVVDAHVSEHMGGELLVGIEAPVLLHETDALELEIGNATRLIGRHLPAHVHEGTALADAIGERPCSFRVQSSSAPHNDAAI
jgi:hypothetical protein